MSTIAEIESAIESLPSREQEELFRFLAERLKARAESAGLYRTRPHPGGVRPGIDADRLGQLPESH